MQNVKHAVIACAGYGSRLGLNIPKCMIKVNERTLLSYLLELTKEIEDVRVVVGFEEDSVIEEVRRYNPNAVIVRNPNYRTTSIAHSYHLATKDLAEPFIVVDGDMAINKQDFAAFLSAIKPGENMTCVAPAQPDSTHFAKVENEQVISVSSSERTDLDWTGISYLSNIAHGGNSRYEFNEVVPTLPIKAFHVRCFDVNTSDDHSRMLHAFDTLGYEEA